MSKLTTCDELLGPQFLHFKTVGYNLTFLEGVSIWKNITEWTYNVSVLPQKSALTVSSSLWGVPEVYSWVNDLGILV